MPTLVLVACGRGNPSAAGSGADGPPASQGEGEGEDRSEGEGEGEDRGEGEGEGDDVEPRCPDASYVEDLSAADADVDALERSYAPSAWDSTALALLQARYPVGRYIIDETRSGGFDCLEDFTSAEDRADFSALARSLSTSVHECGHGLDFERGGFDRALYVLRADLVFDLPVLDTFPLREIHQYTNDDDFYADTYLAGAIGDQFFDSLMEEFTQYVNSLMVAAAMNDQYDRDGGVSERDGILTFMLYLEVYLQHARVHDGATYERILSNAEWREFLLTVWGRAELALSRTAGMEFLGINDDDIESRMRSPDLTGEIDRVRERHGCADLLSP